MLRLRALSRFPYALSAAHPAPFFTPGKRATCRGGTQARCAGRRRHSLAAWDAERNTAVRPRQGERRGLLRRVRAVQGAAPRKKKPGQADGVPGPAGRVSGAPRRANQSGTSRLGRVGSRRQSMDWGVAAASWPQPAAACARRQGEVSSSPAFLRVVLGRLAVPPPVGWRRRRGGHCFSPWIRKKVQVTPHLAGL